MTFNKGSGNSLQMSLTPKYQKDAGKSNPGAISIDSFEINRYGIYNYALNINKVELSKINESGKTGIKATYTLSDPKWENDYRKKIGLGSKQETIKAEVSYYFVNVGKGGHESKVIFPLDNAVKSPDGSTYAVKAECKIIYNGYTFGDYLVNPNSSDPLVESNFKKFKINGKDQTLIKIVNGDIVDLGGIQINWISKLQDFSTWGHTAAEKSASILWADRLDADTYIQYWGGAEAYQTIQNISLGLKETRYITEVYTDCYGAFNPFICETNEDGSFNSSSKVSYDAQSSILKYSSPSEYVDHWYKYSNQSYEMPTLQRTIGYRNMVVGAGGQASATEADKVTVRTNAGQVGIFNSGSSFVAKEIGTSTQLTNLTRTYGNPVAIIRGDYELKDGIFIFDYNSNKPTDATNSLMAAALSDSVVATWSSGGKMLINSNGTITGTNVSLSTPNFKLYKPKDLTDDSITLTPTSDGLSFDIVPDKNDAVMTTNIPHTTVTVNNLVVEPSGSIVMNGSLTVGNLFGKGMTFGEDTEIGYGFKGNKFDINGIHAKGELKAPAIGNLKLLNLKGEINTFSGKELYDFSASINIFEKVQANAEIELKRNKKTGELMPNKLYADMNITTPGFTGVPLVPPTPVAFITGGGIGFDNLADTVNGNWQLLPPLTIKGTVYGNIVGLVDGKVVLEIGPSKLGINGENLKILTASDPKYSEIVKKIGLDVSITGETRRFQPKDQSEMEFTGLNFAGKLGTTIVVPKDTEIINVQGEIGVHGFGGLNQAQNWYYMDVGGNTKATATLKTPKNWKLIGGKSLASVGTEIALGMETAMPINDGINNALNEAFKNARIYGGVMAQASVLSAGLRVWYIIPSEVDYEATVLGLDDWNWEDHGVHVAKLMNSDNQQVGIMGYESGIQSFDEQPVVKLMSGNPSSVTIPHNLNGEDVLIAFIIEGTANQETFQNGLSLKNDSTPITLEWITYDTNDVITNAGTANAMWNEVYDDNGIKKQMAIINVGDLSSGTTINIESESGIDFTTEFASVSPLTDFSADLDAGTAGKITIEPTVTNPVSGEKYVIRTWLGKEKGGSDYMLGMNDYEESETVEFGLTGSVAPTGEYYVTSILMKEVTGEFDETHDGTETAYVPIGREEFNDEISYTNSNQLSAPADVTLTAIGNEGMTASWSSVTDSEGYLVKIYNADGTDTGYSYLYNVEDFTSNTLGLAFDNGANTYSIDMAPTGNGELEANKSYKVGVSAVKYLSSETTTSTETDGTSVTTETKTNPVIGTEKQSTAVNLPKHTDLELEILVNESSVEKNSKTALYECTINGKVTDPSITVDNAGSADVTIIRMDNKSNLNSGTDANTFEIPDFDGSIMLEVVASETKNNITEKTTCYVLISKDDVAPVLTLDSNVVGVNGADGQFTVTGTAESGATVTISDNAQTDPEEYTVNAGNEGKFAVKGTGPEDDKIFTVKAVDSAGNESETLTVLVSPDISAGSNSGSSGSSGGSVIEPDDPVPPITEVVNPFIDVHNDNWFYDDVMFCYANKLIMGTSNIEFSPEMVTTRAMLITILYRLENEPNAVFTGDMLDVPIDKYYTAAMKWAAASNIISGTGDGLYIPEADITREQLAALLYRYAKYKGYDVSAEGNLSAFSDADKISSYALENIRWAVGIGLIQGMGDGTLAPQGIATRAQIAAILHRFIDKYAQ